MDNPSKDPNLDEDNSTPSSGVEEGTTSDDLKEDPKPKPKRSASHQALLKDLYDERSKHRELRDKVATLTESLEEFESTKTELEDLKFRYSRLEEFLLESGGVLSSILDSKTYSKRLFDPETSLPDLVKEWQKNHPSPTSQALSQDSSSRSRSEENSLSDLLRSAILAKR